MRWTKIDGHDDELRIRKARKPGDGDKSLRLLQLRKVVSGLEDDAIAPPHPC